MKHKKETRYLPAKELRVASGAEGKVISGYAVVFDSASVNLGGFTETVSRSAVQKTLSGKPDLLMLRDHSPSLVLGRTTANTLSVSTDNTGVFFRCTLPDTQYANDLAVSIDRGDVSGCSFSFTCEDDQWSKDSNGGLRRDLKQVSISELSVVSFPAYPSTSVRSCPPELRSLLDAFDDDDDDDDGEPCDDPDCEFCQAGDYEDCPNLESRSWAANTLLRLELARRQ